MSNSNNRGCWSQIFWAAVVGFIISQNFHSCGGKKNDDGDSKKAPPPSITKPETQKPPRFAEPAKEPTIEAAAEKKAPSSSQIPKDETVSLDESFARQERFLNLAYSKAFDMVPQLASYLSSESLSKDEIRGRLRKMSDAASTSVAEIKSSEALARLRSELRRLEDEMKQNQRISAAGREKMKVLLDDKKQKLESLGDISGLFVVGLKKFEQTCNTWLADFDALYKLSGTKDAANELMTQVKGMSLPEEPMKKAKLLLLPKDKSKPQGTSSIETITPLVLRTAESVAAQRRAIAIHPGLGVPGSALNLEFIDRHRHYQKEKPEIFSDPDWPTKLADECAKALESTTR